MKETIARPIVKKGAVERKITPAWSRSDRLAVTLKYFLTVIISSIHLVILVKESILVMSYTITTPCIHSTEDVQATSNYYSEVK